MIEEALDRWWWVLYLLPFIAGVMNIIGGGSTGWWIVAAVAVAVIGRFLLMRGINADYTKRLVAYGDTVGKGDFGRLAWCPDCEVAFWGTKHNVYGEDGFCFHWGETLYIIRSYVIERKA